MYQFFDRIMVCAPPIKVIHFRIFALNIFVHEYNIYISIGFLYQDFVSSEVDGRDAVLAPYHSIKLEIDTRNSIYQPWIFSASNSIHTLSDWMVLCYKV